jgi:hypothetical protein
VVVWDKCQNFLVDCAVYAAVQTAPGVFTTRALTEVTSREHLPFTNGDVVVYASNRSGENDVYFQTLATGAEVHLSIPGDQRWPRISGDLISFESKDANEYDIFVYNIRTGKLSRVTNTPLVSETLSEINVCNGVARIVYSIPVTGVSTSTVFRFRRRVLLKIRLRPDGVDRQLQSSARNRKQSDDQVTVCAHCN